MPRLLVIRLLRQLNEAAFVLNVALHDATAATESLFEPISGEAETGSFRPRLRLASTRSPTESSPAEIAAA